MGRLTRAIRGFFGGIADDVAKALGITRDHDALPLDRPPFELRAPSSRPEVAVGPRIGISKAADRPWRYGLAGSRFLSRPFPPPAR